MNTVNATEPRVVITRTYPVPVEKLYRAWTDPSLVRRWFSPSDAFLESIFEADVRDGGQYTLIMRHPDGDEFVAVGTYLTVQPDRKLSFTWKWENSPLEPEETQVTLDFKSVPDGSELTLTHTKLSSEASRDEHAKGWAGCLTSLESFLSS